MKFVSFSDLHAHNFADFSQVDDVTGNSRLTDIVGCLDSILEYCLEHDIKWVLDAGDIFHKRKAVDTPIMNIVYNKIRNFSRHGIRVVMIPGNHTQYDNSDLPEHSIEQFKEIDGVHVLDRFEPFYVYDSDDWDEDIMIYPVPYSKNAEMVKKEIDRYAFQTVNEGIEKNSILLGHMGISGAFVGKSSYAMADAFTVEDLFPHAFRFVSLGHFHKRQDLGGYSHVFYNGAPIQHNFNDEGQDKGFYVLDMATGEKEFVAIPNPKFMTIEVDELNDEVLAELEEKTKGNYVRYRVSANHAHELSEKLPEGSKHRMEVQKDYDGEKRIDVDIDDSYEEIIKKYAEEFNPEALAVGLEIFRDSQTK